MSDSDHISHQMETVRGGSTDDVTPVQVGDDATPVKVGRAPGGRDTPEMRSSGSDNYIPDLFKPTKYMEYEPGRKNCVIQRFDNITNLHNEQKPQTKCTLEFTHDYFKRTKQFYGKGAWYTQTMEYRPDDCSFTEHTRNPGSLASCLKQRNVTKIVLTGDSTMRIRYESLVGMFTNWTCGQLKEAGPNRAQQLEYFTVPGLPPGNLQYDYGGTDRGNITKCSLGRFSVYLEYISLTRVVDLSIRIKKQSTLGLDALSKLEYLLKYYFPHHGWPDLWIYRLPFRHEILFLNCTKEMSLYIAYLLQLLHLCLPPTTTMVFETDSRMCQLPDDIRLQTWNQAFPNSTNNEMLHLFNQAFYDVFGAMTSLLPNAYGFLDDMRLTCSMMCDYQLHDGSHYNEQYYTEINRYALELFCAMGGL